MNHIKLLAAATCILLATAACKKDKTNDPGDGEAAGPERIKEVENHQANFTSYYHYYYDDKGRCITADEDYTHQYQYKDNVVTELVYADYDSTQQILIQRYDYYLRSKYETEEPMPDMVLGTNYFAGSHADPRTYTVYEYNSAGEPVTARDSNDRRTVRTYQYTWRDGDLEELTENYLDTKGIVTYTATTQYTYDKSHLNTLRITHPHFSLAGTSRHLLLSYAKWASNNTNQTGNTSYTFDKNGRVLTSSSGGVTSTYTYEPIP